MPHHTPYHTNNPIYSNLDISLIYREFAPISCLGFLLILNCLIDINLISKLLIFFSQRPHVRGIEFEWTVLKAKLHLNFEKHSSSGK